MVIVKQEIRFSQHKMGLKKGDKDCEKKHANDLQ